MDLPPKSEEQKNVVASKEGKNDKGTVSDGWVLYSKRFLFRLYLIQFFRITHNYHEKHKSFSSGFQNENH